MADLCLIVLEDQSERFSQVVDEMPAIGHLNRLRSPLRSRCCIISTSIPAHYFDLGMRFEPGGGRLRRPIWQQVDDPVGLEIHENGAILETAPKRSGKGERRYRRSLP